MTRTTAVLALMLAAASASAAPVPENPPAAQAAAPADAETLHKELRTLRDTMQNALNKRDLAALLDNVTDDVVFTTMNGDRVIGKEGVRAYYEKMLGGSGAVVKNIETHFEADALSHLYADTAVAFGHSSDRYELAGGEVWEVSPQWSAAIVRRDGRWLVAGFHYSVNMLDNPVLSAQRKLLLGGGAAAVLAAGGLGFLFGRRGRRKAV
ncbi:SnoaL-like domain [Kingella potus]|uniref:SnoaL-like domain n=1 Tax=Kingella potus TaxID=265175 RepID=A0A377QYX0_9NEIS|nr:SgcJ/EcaC family oxidoreductase [Kingella potus]STR00207.1 SnoaL-like domain [Kingella potus]